MSKQSQWRDKYKRIQSSITKYINDTGFWVRLKNYQNMLEEMKNINLDELPPEMRSGIFKELRERAALTMNALVNNYIQQAQLFKLTNEEMGHRFKMDINAVQTEIDRLVNQANIILAGYEKITKDSESLLSSPQNPVPIQEDSSTQQSFQKVFSRE
jgi:hypothetical protein